MRSYEHSSLPNFDKVFDSEVIDSEANPKYNYNRGGLGGRPRRATCVDGGGSCSIR